LLQSGVVTIDDVPHAQQISGVCECHHDAGYWCVLRTSWNMVRKN